MKHEGSPKFWRLRGKLPKPIQELAAKNFELLKTDPRHPSLHFKTVGKYRSIRIGLRYRALGVELPDGVLWFWVGTHSDYDKLIR